MADLGLAVDHRLPGNITPKSFSEWVVAVWKRTRYLREISPDMGLPGKAWILELLHERIVAKRPFAFLVFDIDRFKSVVDVYGWHRAGEFLRAFSNALTDASLQTDGPPPRLAHIGGDDFLALCEPEQVLSFTRRSIAGFEQAADQLYDPHDLRQRYINVPDRRGNLHPAALVTVSVGGVSSGSTSKRYASVNDAASAAIEMKRLAKEQPGSFLIMDRRSAVYQMSQG